MVEFSVAVGGWRFLACVLFAFAACLFLCVWGFGVLCGLGYMVWEYIKVDTSLRVRTLSCTCACECRWLPCVGGLGECGAWWRERGFLDDDNGRGR